MESIKKGLTGAGRWLAERSRRLAAGARELLRNKEKRMRAG